MRLVSIQNHNPHVDTVRSRCYIWLHLNIDIYSCILLIIEEIIYLQNMCVGSSQHHKSHVDTVHSRCDIWIHLNNDNYAYTLHQSYLYHTL
jgi:hypothetical protein